MSNVDIARSTYDAFRRGDLDALRDSFADDVVLVSSDELPLGGVVEGPETIVGNVAELPKYWSSFSVEPEEFIDAGDYVIVKGIQRGSNDKGSFETPFLHLMKYDSEGKVIRGEFLTDSAKAAKLLA